jgi:cytoskeletal protein CcmA (bactofilin family)
MLWRRKGPRARRERDELSAYLDEHSVVEGTGTFNGTAMLNGKFKGLIQSNDTLIVGAKGVINADISAGSVLIRGEVIGNVVATERLELRGSARLLGDVETPVLVVDDGVVFEGHCRMTKGRQTEVAAGRDLSVVTLKR